MIGLPWWVLGGYNLFVLVVYGYDKLRAMRGWRRTPEKTLLLLAACFGGLGALGGIYLFRHKTQKRLFTYSVPALFLIQATIIGYLRSNGLF